MDVDRICAVYAMYIITKSYKSQDNIFNPAEIRDFYTIISSP